MPDANPDGTGTVGALLREFLLHLRYTFAGKLQYLGTTTDLDQQLTSIRDIDALLVLTELDEALLGFAWRLMSRIHEKHNIILHVRITAQGDVAGIPLPNQHLLQIFLNDIHGANPLATMSIDAQLLRAACQERVHEQERRIIELLPQLPANANLVTEIAQCIFDAGRAFLIIAGRPEATKNGAVERFGREYPEFTEIQVAHRAYLAPQSIVDIGAFVLDALAFVKHLLYRLNCPPPEERVLLVNTPSSLVAHPRGDALSADHNMPLGLVCIGSYLRAHGIQVDILDAYALNLGALATVDRVVRNPTIPHIVGFNVCSPNIHIAHRIAGYLKRISPAITVVCGGPHATLASQHTLSTGSVDFVVAGEGEVPMLELVQRILGGQSIEGVAIPGVLRAHSGHLAGIPAPTVLPLDDLPPPDFSLLPLESYFRVRKRLYIHTSRGCAFHCIYCSVPGAFGHVVREASMSQLVAHVAALAGTFGIEEYQVVDDNFSHHNGARIAAFCHELLSRNLAIRWKCQARADQLDATTITLMARTGCFEVDMGIESGDSRVQKYIRKHLDLTRTAEVVALLHAAGIHAKAFFMLGFPNEEWDQLQRTINFAIELKGRGLGDVAFFPVMPFPGTEVARQTGRTVHQGAVVEEVDVFDRSFAAHRLRKYAARPEVSLNHYFDPIDLRHLVKFAYEHFASGTSVNALKKEFGEFKLVEESAAYGL